MISETVLVLAGAFGEHLDAERVAAAIARGLEADGRLHCDRCPLERGRETRPGEVAVLLEAIGFDVRMRAARAVVIACERLEDRSLAGSVAFEAATRARQGGVPAYAITAHDELDPFEARIVDLQVILQAADSRSLSAAGRKLAAFV